MPVTTLVDELRKAANELGWRDSSYEDNLYSTLMAHAADEIERLWSRNSQVDQWWEEHYDTPSYHFSENDGLTYMDIEHDEHQGGWRWDARICTYDPPASGASATF